MRKRCVLVGLLLFFIVFCSFPINSKSLFLINSLDETPYEKEVMIEQSLVNYDLRSNSGFSVPVPQGNDAGWNTTFGGLDFEAGFSLVESQDGGIIIAGRTYTYGAGDSDVFLVKTDADGSLLWSHTFGGSRSDMCWSLVECQDGGFALGCRTDSFGAGAWDMWLIRTNSTGHLQWSQTFGGSSHEHGMSIVECADHGFALSGSTQSFGGGWGDMYVVRTDENGTLLWSKTFGGTDYESGWRIITCSAGGFAIAGYNYSEGPVDRDFWLVRIDDDGNHLWDQYYIPGSAEEWAFGLVEADDGGFVLTGETASIGAGLKDIWVVRTDATGNHLWNRTFGGTSNDIGRWIIKGTYGGYVIGGETESYGAGQRDAWLIRIDANGNHLWNRTFGDSNDENCYEVIESRFGGFTFTGQTNSYGAGDYDLWLVRDFSITWTETPANQLNEFGQPFSYDVNATTPYSVDQWWINDTSQFTINTNGVITNTTALPLGQHGLQIWVNDTAHDFITTTFTLTTQDTIPPTWIEVPTTQYVEFNNGFQYNVNATDLDGIHHWWINDTATFAIDVNGLITNITALTIGAYGLEVQVYDPSNNYDSALFTIIVQDTTSPSWVIQPTDQTIEYGSVFDYQLSAWDLTGLHIWTVNDTTQFTCDATGRITSIGILTPNRYGLQININDTHNNLLTSSITITVQDTTPPSWVIAPTDQILEYGEGLDYQLSANDLSGISTWQINDTTSFSIDNTGRITSLGNLQPGTYGLTVSVTDPYENTLSATFTITIQPPTPPPIPGFPIEAIALGLIITLGFGIIIRRRRRK
jgi:hypothetical protein